MALQINVAHAASTSERPTIAPLTADITQEQSWGVARAPRARARPRSTIMCRVGESVSTSAAATAGPPVPTCNTRARGSIRTSNPVT